MSITSEFIVTDENRELYDRVIKVTQAESPVRLFIYGPASSGKTSLVHERGRERDLLSDKTVAFCHALELVSMFNLGEVGEAFLERAGSADVLLLDGFEAFADGDAVTRELGALLLAERNRKQLSTLVFSRRPLDEFSSDAVGAQLEGYEACEIAPA